MQNSDFKDTYGNSNGFGGFMLNNRGKVSWFFGFCILLAKSPSGSEADDQELREPVNRDQRGGKH